MAFGYKNMQINDGHLQIGMFVSIALQLVYISKFFYWEMGYSKFGALVLLLSVLC